MHGIVPRGRGGRGREERGKERERESLWMQGVKHVETNTSASLVGTPSPRMSRVKVVWGR